MERIDPGTVLVRTGLVIGSIVMIVLVLEGVLYLYWPSPSQMLSGVDYRWCRGPHRRGRFDSRLGWIHQPNSQHRARRSRHDDWDLYTFDHQGFRDVHDSGDSTTIILGDSFMRGTLAGDSETLVHYLDRWSPDRRFVNTGVWGYGTAQELLLYESIVEDIAHDQVVLGFFINDPADNTNPDPRRPRFSLQNGTLKQVHRPVNPNQRPWRFPGWFLKQNSHTVNLLQRMLTVTRNLWSDGDNSTHELFPAYIQRRQMRLTRTLLLRIAGIARDHGARLMILALPTRTLFRPDNPYYFRPEATRRYWHRQVKMLEATASRSTNVRLMNLESPVGRAIERGERLYGRIDGHFNERGQWFAARTIWNRLHRHGWIDTGAPRPLRTRPGRPRCPGHRRQ